MEFRVQSAESLSPKQSLAEVANVRKGVGRFHSI